MNGRKRHIVVDTLGLLVRVCNLPANLADGKAAPQVLVGLLPRSGGQLWADAGYRSRALASWVGAQTWQLTIVQRSARWVWVVPGTAPAPRPTGIEPLPRRWVVERTFAWLGRNRRLSKDYEQRPRSGEAWCYLAMSRLMVRRLTGLARPEARVAAPAN